jgi:CheY-like chemotaxis protein
MTPDGEVLLIEDDEATRNLFAQALTVAGYRVRTAADGLSALRVLEVFTPDVIVVDLRLPVADGSHVVEGARRRPSTSRIPIIAISGFDEELDVARADPEVLAVIRKPFTPDELVRAVTRAREYAAASN